MSPIVQIDEIDARILRGLVRDARTKLKDIAKDCGLSSAAVFKRVKRLKATGVITGAVLFSDISLLGYMYPASIHVELNRTLETQIIKSVGEHVNLVLLSQSVGKDNLFFFVVAKSLQEIDRLKQIIKRKLGTGRISVSLWGTPCFNFESVDLKPTRA